MNLQSSIKAIYILFSLKREFQIVIWTFIIVLSLPFISVVILTQTGVQIVSDTLASDNPQGHIVDIHDPTGKIVSQVQVVTTWPVQGVVTLEFGESNLPYQILHTGIDIAGSVGTPVKPFMKGKVIYAGEISWGYGRHVILDNGNNITSIYAHLDWINVSKNQEVTPNDVVGTIGDTGWSTGPHTHFQINVLGVPVNPRTFIAENP